MTPNILFLFPDQWRGDWWEFSGHGIPVKTPTINSIAARGTVFDYAITPSPLCAPARACIATGQSYPAANVRNNNLNFPPTHSTIYRSMRDAGYHVMGCGKFDLHKAEYSWGPEGSHLLDEWGFDDGVDNEGKIDGVEAYRKGTPGPYLSFLQERGLAQAHVEDFRLRIPHETFPTSLKGGEYCDDWITQNALDLLTRAPGGTPWFLQVNWAGPHDPFDVTGEMHEWYRDTEFSEPFNAGNKPIDHVSIRRNYAAMIQNIDRGIARILDHPRVRAEIDRTVVVFASDHGEMLGDHGYYGKCTPHNGSVHVPLVVAGPGIKQGARVSEPYSILDLPGTFADLTQSGLAADKDSRSLRPALSGRQDPDRVVITALDVPANPDFQWRAAIDTHFKYIRWNDGRTALFERIDYGELTDVSSAHPAEVSRLGGVLSAEE